MAENKSLVNLGDWATPVNTLIEKISNAVGILYEPKRIIKQAKANATAEKIKAINNLEIEDLQKRALTRFINEETIKQQNIESIIGKSIPEISDNANPNGIDNDWLLNYFDNAKFISNELIQNLWAKLLAGEANKPGSISKKTLKVLSDLDTEDAISFNKLCSFVFYVNNVPQVFIFNSEDEFYNNYISFDVLNNLNTLGLISMNSFLGYMMGDLPKHYSMIYGDNKIQITGKNETDNKLACGKCILTKAGTELVQFCSPIYEKTIFEITYQNLVNDSKLEKVELIS